jgi:hypothetical protein
MLATIPPFSCEISWSSYNHSFFCRLFVVVSNMTSSTKILISMYPCNATVWNGIVLGFKTYHRTTTSNLQKNEWLYDDQLISHEKGGIVANISYLNEYTNYTIQVSLFTRKGEGPNVTLFIATDQDGKLSSWQFCYLIYIANFYRAWNGVVIALPSTSL